MMDLRCVLGRHGWRAGARDGAPVRHDVRQLTCRRCGASTERPWDAGSSRRQGRDDRWGYESSGGGMG